MARKEARHHATASPLAYPAELEPFLHQAPLPVLVRSVLEWTLQQTMLEDLFEQTAQEQYTRELTLTYLVEAMLDVACSIQPSARKAFVARSAQLAVSRQAVYAKLRRMEPAISEAVVQRFSTLANRLIAQLEPLRQEPVPGFEARIVDGTVLGGRSEHRIKPLREIWSAPLSALALAVYAPAQRTVGQVVLAEDAYAGERTLLEQLQVRAGELWIADRNFCVRSFLFHLHACRAAFLVRWHATSCPFVSAGPLQPAQGTRQGAMEQPVWLNGPAGKERLAVRRIVLPLPKATRNGDTELVLMTTLPATVAADELCDAYRARWQIESHFQHLTQQLHCEPPALNYPRAALFAFAMAVCAGNALAAVQQALQTVHGQEPVQELSYYSLVLEISQIWLGMAIVMPAQRWQFVRESSAVQCACWLRQVAQFVPMDRFKRSRRGLKQPRKKQPMTRANLQFHVSNKRLLDQSKLN